MNEVMVNDSFSPKDILCLQYAGSKPSRIMTSGLDQRKTLHSNSGFWKMEDLSCPSILLE